MKFNAHLWKVSKDHEGEITLVLKVPLVEAKEVINLPTETNLKVEISAG